MYKWLAYLQTQRCNAQVLDRQQAVWHSSAQLSWGMPGAAAASCCSCSAASWAVIAVRRCPSVSRTTSVPGIFSA